MKVKNNVYMLDIACLSTADIRDKWYQKMPSYRKEKIDLFKPEKNKRLSLGAGILLDIALKNAGLGQYTIAFGEHEKPYIPDCKDLFFNISHSGELAVLAISDRETGIDIQKIQHFDSALINHVFSESEQLLAKDICPDDNMNRVYTRMWSMKESVMKYSGLGIALEPHSISLELSSSGKIRAICEGYSAEHLNLIEYPVQDYALTVCTTYSEFAKAPQMIDPDIL